MTALGICTCNHATYIVQQESKNWTNDVASIYCDSL